MDGTCTLLDKENSIVGMLDKAHFNWNDKNDYYKTVNIYKLKSFQKNIIFLSLRLIKNHSEK